MSRIRHSLLHSRPSSILPLSIANGKHHRTTCYVVWHRKETQYSQMLKVLYKGNKIFKKIPRKMHCITKPHSRQNKISALSCQWYKSMTVEEDGKQINSMQRFSNLFPPHCRPHPNRGISCRPPPLPRLTLWPTYFSHVWSHSILVVTTIACVGE